MTAVWVARITSKNTKIAKASAEAAQRQAEAASEQTKAIQQQIEISQQQAKAAEKQAEAAIQSLKEAQKQREEAYRPRLMVYFERKHEHVLHLVIRNIRNETAWIREVKTEASYLTRRMQPPCWKLLARFTNSCIELKPGQKILFYDPFNITDNNFCTLSPLEKALMEDEPLKITLKYKNMAGKWYEDTMEADLKQASDERIWKQDLEYNKKNSAEIKAIANELIAFLEHLHEIVAQAAVRDFSSVIPDILNGKYDGTIEKHFGDVRQVAARNFPSRIQDISNGKYDETIAKDIIKAAEWNFASRVWNVLNEKYGWTIEKHFEDKDRFVANIFALHRSIVTGSCPEDFWSNQQSKIIEDAELRKKAISEDKTVGKEYTVREIRIFGVSTVVRIFDRFGPDDERLKANIPKDWSPELKFEAEQQFALLKFEKLLEKRDFSYERIIEDADLLYRRNLLPQPTEAEDSKTPKYTVIDSSSMKSSVFRDFINQAGWRSINKEDDAQTRCLKIFTQEIQSWLYGIRPLIGALCISHHASRNLRSYPWYPHHNAYSSDSDCFRHNIKVLQRCDYPLEELYERCSMWKTAFPKPAEDSQPS